MNLQQIRNKLNILHRFLKKTNACSKELQSKWNNMFLCSISPQDADYFLQHYREMYKKKGGRRTLKHKSGKRTRNYRKTMVRRHKKRSMKRGGASHNLAGAPLTYSMTPGTTANVYGKFPTEIATDPASIKNLDQFYSSALTKGCGIENSTRQVPATMGSNKVGGRRKSTRKMKGGDLLSGLQMRGLPAPYYATAPPNFIQTTAGDMAGMKPFAPPSPVDHTWSYSKMTPTVFAPNMVTTIRDTTSATPNRPFSELAYSIAPETTA
jgi:hypothetical protein